MKGDLLKLRPQNDLVVIFSEGEVDFSWTREEIKLARTLWERGIPIQEMVEELRPKVSEGFHTRSYCQRELDVFMLLAYLGLYNQIPEREGWVWGR